MIQAQLSQKMDSFLECMQRWQATAAKDAFADTPPLARGGVAAAPAVAAAMAT